MKFDEKMDLVKHAYENAKQLIIDEDDKPQPITGSRLKSIENAHALVKEVAWMFDEDVDVPIHILRFTNGTW